MKPIQSFDFMVNSVIISGEKPTKGVDAELAPNPNQMNRLTGFLQDGTKVVVSQRPGKGGMDFNKLLGGKVFTVAADGFSPVYEKGDDKKPTKTQKTEKGIPLYSSSGFYSMSSKEYPALAVISAYTLLSESGEFVYIITDQQMAAKQNLVLSSEFDIDLLLLELTEKLGDAQNCVSQYDEAVNKRRQRLLVRARDDAEAEGEQYSGASFAPLAVSRKDGNPFVLFCWKEAGGLTHQAKVSRMTSKVDNTSERTVVEFLVAAEAVLLFQQSPEYLDLLNQVEAGLPVSVNYVGGNVLRTSVSFRQKFTNAANSGSAYGDAVYIRAATKQWTKGILAIMQSSHPSFPAQDYNAHHYVAMCRQAEVGMSKVVSSGKGAWTSPVAPSYDLAALLTA
ncbi:MAG: hypothetical protein Q7S87_09000 [Agitococcus sp.]|nr:hypothetical protein [Agitococcus sp.]